jgi:intracellular septation protein A
VEPTILRLPGLRATARHAGRSLIEGTIAPLIVFYGGLQLAGLTGAIVLGLAWAVGTIVVRRVQRQPIPGILILTTVAFAARGAVALATDSVFVYFLQPTLGTLLVAAAFLVSVPLGRPLARRFAHDFVPLPEQLNAADWLDRFFLRISLLWAFVFLANGLISLWLLLSQSVGTFLVARTAVSTGLTVAAIAGSALAFVLVARENNVRLAFR